MTPDARHATSLPSRVCRALPHLVIAVLLFALGVLLHECGHGIAAALSGARIVRINVLGLDLWPRLHLDIQGGYWGRIWWQGTLTPRQRAWVGLSGNLATMAVSLVALPLLWLPGLSRTGAFSRGANSHCERSDAPGRGGNSHCERSAAIPSSARRQIMWLRTTLVVLSLFFLDTLLHTLPTLGLPMYLFFGKRDPASVSEGYLAAQALGCPGPVFQGIVVAYSLIAVGMIVYRLVVWGSTAKTAT